MGPSRDAKAMLSFAKFGFFEMLPLEPMQEFNFVRLQNNSATVRDWVSRRDSGRGELYGGQYLSSEGSTSGFCLGDCYEGTAYIFAGRSDDGNEGGSSQTAVDHKRHGWLVGDRWSLCADFW